MDESSSNYITGHTENQADVIKAEAKYLKLTDDKTVSGLAISGGGIRSASFGLGVMQGLVAKDQLSKMDYLSTVSGGGYIGSALTWALKKGGKHAGTTKDKFPLGKKGTIGGKYAEDAYDSPEDDDNKLLDFIRQHANYLTPTKSLDMISFVAVVMRSMLMSLFVYFCMLTIFLTTTIHLIYSFCQINYIKDFLNYFKSILPGEATGNSSGALIIVALIFVFVMVIMGFIYSIGTFITTEKIRRNWYLKFIKWQATLGVMLKICLTCVLLGTLPYVSGFLLSHFNSFITYLTASGSTAFGAVVGFWKYVKSRNNDKSSSGSSDLLVYAGAFALFYGILLLSYLITTNFFLVHDQLYFFRDNHFYWYLGLIVITVLFATFVNLNLLGPHYIWRSRLMEAFLPDTSAVYTNNWEAANEADSALMEDMCDEYNPRPYHIVNTNVILANSASVKYSSRGGDNFIISRLFCGSDATGWKKTNLFQKNNSRGMTLSSAMATSAAALNPDAGVAGTGVTRNTVVSMLLAILSLRLGYWASNPRRKNLFSAPNFFIPGLTAEILRAGLTEDNSHLQLSDGGHFENLAIYELIRRKLSLIVLSDGGADPGFNFDDLANVVEKVRVDFETRIAFRDNYKLDDILPGTGGTTAFISKYDIAKNGYAIADIEYSDGKKGILVYIKLAMIEGLPTDIYSYKGNDKTFPHQSTSDQFFDEKQFEAYRELGYYITKQMLNSEDGKKIFELV